MRILMRLKNELQQEMTTLVYEVTSNMQKPIQIELKTIFWPKFLNHEKGNVHPVSSALTITFNVEQMVTEK